MGMYGGRAGIALIAIVCIIVIASGYIATDNVVSRGYFNDKKAPSIVSYYHKPDLPIAWTEVKIYARILDDVSVKKATIFYDNDSKEIRAIEMEHYNTEWFVATIPANDVKESGFKYWIYAEDPSGNKVTGDVEKVPVKPSLTKTFFSITPSVKTKLVEVVATKNSNSEYTASIAITNPDERKLQSLRLMLSPELGKMFRLSDYAIRSIDPNGTYTVDLKLVGKIPVDAMGEPVAYRGQLIVMGEHLSPMMLNISIEPEKSSQGASYIDNMVLKAEKRYNRASPLLLDVLKSVLLQPKPSYQVSSDGARIIQSPASTFTIKNTGEEPLKNVRIQISSIGKQFLLEKNIAFIEPNGQISIPLISKIETDSGSTRPYKGEVVIRPEYGIPMTLPIEIAPRPAKTDPFEVSTLHGKDGIYTMSEKVVIKNLGGRSLDSVKIMLPSNLEKYLALSEGSIKKIWPGEEHTIETSPRGGIPGMISNISGDLIVASEHHGAKTIPIKLTWREITGKYFEVYARDNANDLLVAHKLAFLLDKTYKDVSGIVGETKTKSVIYILDTADEMKSVIGTDANSFYDYTNDLILICKCSDDLIRDALYEHVYRTIVNNNPSYSNTQKILFDHGNWLVDGLARYTVVSIMGEGGLVKRADAYPVELEWYGTETQAYHDASYAFVKYLSEKYGEKVVGEILRYIGAGQISNHRCDTLENCSVLQAVYKASDLDINNKRYTLNFDAIVHEWREYMQINDEMN